MAPWKIFVSGCLLLVLIFAGGILLSRRKQRFNSETRKAIQGARMLVLSLWLASLSILAYIAFVFGKG
jgi:hypothetical protein